MGGDPAGAASGTPAALRRGPELPPLDAALWTAVRAGSTVAERRPLYAALPGVFDALAAHLAAALPWAPASDVTALVGWCVRAGLHPVLHAAASTDVHAVAFPPLAVLRADAAGVAAPPAAPPRPGMAFERRLCAAAASARARYVRWGDDAIRHPLREFYAAVGRRAGVSARQAQALLESDGLGESLDAGREVGSRAQEANGRGVERALADVLAAPGAADAGIEAEEAAAAAGGRLARAGALFARLLPEFRLAVARAYGLGGPPAVPPLGSPTESSGAGPGAVDRRGAPVAGPPAAPWGAVSGGARRALVLGERALGAALWVLVVAAGRPRRVWRRHPARCVGRQTDLLLRRWSDARGGLPASALGRRRATWGVARGAAGGGVAGGGALDGLAEPPIPRAEGTYAVEARALARALRRVGLGALERGRRARPGGASARAPAAVLTLAVVRGFPPKLLVQVAHVGGTTVGAWMDLSDPARWGAPANDATDLLALLEPLPQRISVVGCAGARAFAAAVRGLAPGAPVQISGEIRGLAVAAAGRRTVLDAPDGAARGRPLDAPEDSMAGARAPAGVVVAAHAGAGFAVRAAALIRAALRLAPVTLAGAVRGATRRTGGGRGPAMLAVSDGVLRLTVGGDGIWGLYETAEDGSFWAGPGPAGWRGDDGRGVLLRLPGAVLAHVADVFDPGDVVTLSCDADGSCRLAGPTAVLRLPDAAVPDAAGSVALRAELRGETPSATHDARVLHGAARARAAGRSAAGAATRIRVDIGGGGHAEVPAGRLAAALGGLPSRWAALAAADAVTVTDVVPVLVIRPAWGGEGAAGAAPAAGRPRGWADRTLYLVARVAAVSAPYADASPT